MVKVLIVDFLLKYICFFSKILFFIRRKDSKDNGMVVVEVGFLCGFIGDLFKINVWGFDYKEIMLDKFVLYFKNVCKIWLFCKCVLIVV